VNVDAPGWTTTTPPWVHAVATSTPEMEEPPADGLVRVLEGHELRTEDQVFENFARAFAFPDYFGRNWDAFDECMGDLAWLPARSYRVVIMDAEHLLDENMRARGIFLRIMRDLGRQWGNAFALGPEWGGGEVPFNTILVGAPEDWVSAQ
jgi:RNAse (barnase) inhibitor barstar